MTKLITTLGFLALVGFGGAGCSKIDNAIDCHKVCDRYRDCFDSKYDVDACADRCRDESSRDADYQSKADQCEACIDDKSCTSATFSCGASCGTIVP